MSQLRCLDRWNQGHYVVYSLADGVLCILQDEKDRADVHNIMEGLRAAAAAVQAAEFRKAYGHLSQEPQSASPEILDQLKRAQEVG